MSKTNEFAQPDGPAVRYDSRNGILRLSAVFALALLVWGALMTVFLDAAYPARPAFSDSDPPILSVELPPNDSALQEAVGRDPMLGARRDAKVHKVVEIDTELDFVFIFCYTAFLLTFTAAMFPTGRKSLRWICYFIIVAAALADCAENTFIFRALYHGNATAWSIRTPSEIKWILLNVITAFLGFFLVTGIGSIFTKRGNRILGIALIIGGTVGLAGLDLHIHFLLQIGMFYFALAPASVVCRQAVKRAHLPESPVLEKDGALHEEYQHIYGPLVVAEPATFLQWLRSGSPLAGDILEPLGIKSLPDVKDFDKIRPAIEARLAELAYGSEPLEQKYGAADSAEPASSPEQKAHEWHAVQVLRTYLIDTDGETADEDSDSLRHANISVLRGHNRGLERRTSPGPNHSALCLSGGGIRSATFNLGILQGLHKFGKLEEFAYLSTVSGGGFIGGWLSALRLRTQKQPLNIENGTKAVEHLRDYSSYLSPEVGLLSADTWSLISVYLRNLVLTWMVILPCMAAALTVPRLILGVYSSPANAGLQYLFITIGTMALMLGLGYIGAHLPSHRLRGSDDLDALRRHFRRFAIAVFLFADVFWFFVSPFSRAWFVPVIAMEFAAVLPLFKRFDASPDGNPVGSAQIEFLARAILPFMIAAVCLTNSWNWLDWSSALRNAPAFLIGGTFAVVLPWTICSLYARRNRINRFDGSAASRQAVESFEYQLGLCLMLLFVAALLGSAAGWAIASRNWIHYSNGLYVSFSVPILIGVLLLTGTLMAGLISRSTRDDDEEWWARAGAWLMIAAAVWIVTNVCVLLLPAWSSKLAGDIYRRWSSSQLNWSDIGKAVAAATGVLSTAGALIAGFSGKTAGSKDAESNVSPVLSILAPVGATVGLVYILVTLALLTDNLIQAFSRRLEVDLLNPWLLGAVLVALGSAGCLAGAAIDTNKFSLHYYWRNRIVRAYLGASNADPASIDPFIGFSAKDNLQMWELRQLKNRRLFHVLNVALNVTATRNLAWQERKAESFTISPLRCGSYNVGYRNSRHYGQMRLSGKQGLSLGAAMALSGAAVSPNMGYMVSSPILRFLMTLFNLRLGAWLGNPGKYGEKTFRKGAPGHSIKPIIREAFGLIDQSSPWVYLSDGGHFENFGLYEMVRRRCEFIVVSDASTDTNYDFESLAVSVRKIRIDLEASVTITQAAPIGRFLEKERGGYYATGEIKFNDGFVSKLVYIKASMDGSEPEDVLNYQRSHKDFPQESIADQFFTESQFESYRALGEHIIEKMMHGTGTFTSFNDWYDALKGAASDSDETATDLIESLKKAVAN